MPAVSTKQHFIYPPRPIKEPIARSSWPYLQQRGFIAQLKYSDTHTTISLNKGDLVLYKRDGNQHVQYQMPDAVAAQIKQLPRLLGLKANAWQYFDGGILDTRHRAIKNLVVIWDILVKDGEHLLGTTYAERYNIIRSNFTERFIHRDFDLGIKVSDNIIIPDNFAPDQWGKQWDMLTELNTLYGFAPSVEKGAGSAIIEGLLLKKLNGRLEPALREDNNQSWQVRSRIMNRRHRS